jgi:DNA-binding protein YbaB
MFSKLKQFKELRSQAKTMQESLAKETVSEEKNGVSITLNGNLEVISLSISENLNKTSQEEALKSCFNGAVKKAQRVMAKKMQEMGGIPGLS